MADLVIREGLVISDDELIWSYARSGGPGGQNVNKVNSKAVLKWDPREGFLPPSAWIRFRAIANRFMTSDEIGRAHV